ncbi:hypothetical protein BH23PAT2_BH23PAT2_02050 [soil metagenome]
MANPESSELLGPVVRRYIYLWIMTFVCAVFAIVYAYVTIGSYHKYVIQDAERISDVLRDEPRTAIVFGSAINPEGQPRSVLRERLDTAHALYEAGVINRIIVSGHKDTVLNDYDEPSAMLRYLVDKSIPRDYIIKDNKGDNTYETCRQSKQLYRTSQTLLITQVGHMDRALYVCRHHGIEAYGYTAESIDSNRLELSQSYREALSNVKALLQVTFQ